MDDDSEARESLTPQLRAMRAANERRKAQGLPIGRPKGTPNKLTARIREGILHVYDALGGHEGFERWARKHPAAFYALAMKGVPREREANAIGSGVTIVLGDGRPVIDVTPTIEVDAHHDP